MRRFTAIIFVLSVTAHLVWGSVDEIRALLDSGKYSAASEKAREEIELDPTMEGTLNALLGEALYLSGDEEGAAEALYKAISKGVADGYRWLGRMAYDNYDYGTASTNYNKYFELKKKASKPVSVEATEERSRIALARRYFDRVEHIQIIDSLIVDKEDFFKNYRLPISSGRLLDSSAIPVASDDEAVAAMVFATERGDMRMWAQLDSAGQKRLAQSVKLTDGSWDEAVMTDSILNIGNLDYPFLTSDGMTLYFASDGPESLGGLDIFMATRDPSDDSYRLPQNVGMPYNSPWDDYMMAIDEVNNVGWWATDRNRLDGQVTIYVFIPNKIRENYAEDDEDLQSLAAIHSISDTWEEEADYESILAIIREIDPEAENVVEELHLVFPDGTVYTQWDNFKNEDARSLMEAYIDSELELTETQNQLTELRRQYYESQTEELADEIQGLETAVDAFYKNMRKQRSEIIRLEMNEN